MVLGRVSLVSVSRQSCRKGDVTWHTLENAVPPHDTEPRLGYARKDKSSKQSRRKET